MPTPTTDAQMKSNIDQVITSQTAKKSITPISLGTLLKSMIDFCVSFFILTSKRGAINGVASLDGSGKVPAGQLPDGIGGGDSAFISDAVIISASRDLATIDKNKLLIVQSDFQLTIPSEFPFVKGDKFVIQNESILPLKFHAEPGTVGDIYTAIQEAITFIVVSITIEETDYLLLRPLCELILDDADSKFKTGTRYILDNPPAADTGGATVETICSITEIQLNAAPIAPAVYIPITLADFQEGNIIEAIHYTVVGGAIAHLSLTATDDGLSPELWKLESESGGVGDNTTIQNMLDMADLTQELNFLKIKFSIDESIDNPQDFDGLVITVKVQLMPLLF